MEQVPANRVRPSGNRGVALHSRAKLKLRILKLNFGDEDVLPVAHFRGGVDPQQPTRPPCPRCGIQADLKTINAFGAHGCSLVTSMTAQNSQSVKDIAHPPADFIDEQYDALIEDMPPAAIKIGMLGTDDVVRIHSESIGETATSTTSISSASSSASL